MNLSKLKLSLRHSEKNPSWKILGATPGFKYDVARCNYIVIANEDSINETNKEEAYMHAKLFIKAPEMLEALETLLECYTNECRIPNVKVIHQVKSLINEIEP